MESTIAGVTLPCELPVVAAPMAGGPSTPALVAAVAAAGGFGYLAAGYLSPAALHDTITRTRALNPAPLGINVFVPGPDDADPAAIAAYAESLRPEAQRLGVALGDPSWDDDAYGAKVELLAATRVHTVSFTFGCPPAADVETLHRCGARVAITVTGPAEAALAAAAGADTLVVQGTEAGGHQGRFDPSTPNRTPLLEALGAVRDATELPLIAAGAIMSAADAEAAFAHGAVAVQIGTALLRTPEAGTSPPYRAALAGGYDTGGYDTTVITRAFSGRWARGLENRWALEHPDAPSGYPQINALTKPLRAAATKAGDPGVPNLWAGVGWRRARAEPAGAVVRRIAGRPH